MLYFFTGKIMGLSDFLGGALHKIGGDLYSSSAHECAIGEVSVRTEGLKTPSYQSVYTGHIPFSPAMSRSITENGVSYIWERIYKNNPH